MIRKSYLFFVLVFILSSCVSVYFDQVKPKKGKIENSFPTVFQGRWLSDLDTVIIQSSCADFLKYKTDSATMITTFEIERFCLSDSIKLYKADKYYVANLFKKDFGWEIYIFDIQENGNLFAYYPMTPPFMGEGHGLKI